jgi:hypothetical protein
LVLNFQISSYTGSAIGLKYIDFFNKISGGKCLSPLIPKQPQWIETCGLRHSIEGAKLSLVLNFQISSYTGSAIGLKYIDFLTK